MRKDKKGQAAMEFLMTYGWAILAAIVVIGILGYYYFSSDIMKPKAAIVTAPFYLNAQNAKTGGVTLELKNNGGETMAINNVSITNCGSNSTSLSVASGSSAVSLINCTLTSGDTFEGDITITYRKAGSSVDLTSTGSITEPVV